MSASDSADSSHSSDTKDSNSANTSDSSMPGPHRFESSESDSKASGTSSNDDNSVLEGLKDLLWCVQLKNSGCTSGITFNCNISMVNDQLRCIYCRGNF